MPQERQIFLTRLTSDFPGATEATDLQKVSMDDEQAEVGLP